MITVKIPAAIRVCSPVVSATGREGAVFDFEGGGGQDLLVAVRSVAGEHHREMCWLHRSSLALIISDPTGAAHLAWWLLYGHRWTMTEHAERIDAMGWTLAGYQAAVDCAARGLPADLARLADYAHRVAGVTNG